MSRIHNSCIVLVQYECWSKKTGTKDEYELFEETEDNDPFEYEHGKNETIFEVEVEGLEVGDRIEEEYMNPYGEWDKEEVMSVPIAAFDEIPKLGEFTEVSIDDEEIEGEVMEIDDTHVFIDLNPPLCGCDVLMKVKIIGIKKAI